MKTKAIIPAFFFIFLSLAAKPSDQGTGEAVEKLKTKLELPVELFDNKSENQIRLSFKVNEQGKAEEVIINAENEKIKQFVQESLNKLEFNEKGETINILMRFKLQ